VSNEKKSWWKAWIVFALLLLGFVLWMIFVTDAP